MIRVHKDDIKWVQDTKHHIGNDNSHESKLLFIVDLETNDKKVAVRRSESLIAMLATATQAVKNEYERIKKKG